MDLKNQKRMAAEILKCGEGRVWIHPDRQEDVADSITREDIRRRIVDGAIKKHSVRGVSRGRARYAAAQRRKGRRRGHGSRRGTKKARLPQKERWMRTIRPMRRLLRELRDEGRITRRTYRKYYLMAKGGMFKSKAHLEQQLLADGRLLEGE